MNNDFNKNAVKLVGVTFCNSEEDGGENRQQLLEQLYGRPTMVTLVHSVYRNPESNTDELAIKVYSTELQKVIGFIPKAEIENYVNVEEMVLFVSHYKDCYAGSLVATTPPTPKQYGLLKSKLMKREITKLPAYDRNIYSHVISELAG